MAAATNVDSLKIVVGVAGGIAAFKAPSVVRQFTEKGHSVTVVPTESALRFVGETTFAALSGNVITTTVFEGVDEVRHVRVGQEADLIVIAPATADLMARMAMGRADDMLTATLLVATCPVVVAPAMHTEMWHHPATVANVQTLRQRGIIVLEPAHGRLTGKDTGPGRMLEPEQIASLAMLAATKPLAFTRDLEELHVLISAGGTREPLDPVRFIGNRSSGRQGFALAEIAAQRGAKVTVVAGAVDSLPTPAGATVISVETTREMEAAMNEVAPTADVIIMSAAVADYRPETVITSKAKKGSDSELTTIKLVENPDILAGLVQSRTAGALEKQPTIVGFAAETGDENGTPLEYGRAKLARKGCDVLLCNVVGDGKAFGTTDNAGWILDKNGGETEVEFGSKFALAAALLDSVRQLRN